MGSSNLADPAPSPAPRLVKAAASSAAASLRIDLFTIFPAELAAMSKLSILGRAQKSGLVDIRCWDLRLATTDVHRTIDGAPLGGGPGVILKPAPVFAAVEKVSPPRPLLLLDAGGRRFDQAVAAELAESGGFSLLCGRYEGVDERIRTNLVDGSLSVGDVVLAGGEFAAMLITEAVARLVPGVLGNADSSLQESFATGLLEHPQWTRPASFRGLEAPAVLRSGDHARVDRWRHAMALVRTASQRPDLLAARGVSDEDRELLAEFGLGLETDRSGGPA